MRLRRNEVTVKRSRQMSVQSVKRETHTAGLLMYDNCVRQGHGLFFFFNKSEILEAATIIEACIPVHTMSHSQHKTGQECD